MLKRNALPKISLVVALSIIGYLLLFPLPQRLPDSYGDAIDWELVAISVVLPLAIISTVALGVWRASLARDYLWIGLQLSLFPLAWVYTIWVNKGTGANNSFKPTPLRGVGKSS